MLQLVRLYSDSIIVVTSTLFGAKNTGFKQINFGLAKDPPARLAFVRMFVRLQDTGPHIYGKGGVRVGITKGND